jgi:hypothetical protein
MRAAERDRTAQKYTRENRPLRAMAPTSSADSTVLLKPLGGVTSFRAKAS